MVYLYKCAFSNAEMFSDAFPTSEEYNGFILAVKSSIVDKQAMKFDIGDCDEVEDKDERVNDIADGFKYNQTTFTKAQFTAWLKPYVKRIGERIKENEPDNEEKIKAFQKNSTDFAKFLLGKFDDFEFFMNEENDMDGAIAMSYWQNTETDKGPTFLYFKDGMRREKI